MCAVSEFNKDLRIPGLGNSLQNISPKMDSLCSIPTLAELVWARIIFQKVPKVFPGFAETERRE
jgi:hypothetical protein